MQLAPATVRNYLTHAFDGMHRVLGRLDDDRVNRRPEGWGTNSVAGLIVHCCELTTSWFETPGLGRESVRDRDAEFETTATIAELRQRIDDTVRRAHALADEFDVGPTANRP